MACRTMQFLILWGDSLIKRELSCHAFRDAGKTSAGRGAWHGAVIHHLAGLLEMILLVHSVCHSRIGCGGTVKSAGLHTAVSLVSLRCWGICHAGIGSSGSIHVSAALHHRGLAVPGPGCCSSVIACHLSAGRSSIRGCVGSILRPVGNTEFPVFYRHFDACSSLARPLSFVVNKRMDIHASGNGKAGS